MFLLELSKNELPFVFKGGTSLSKGYALIDRFSEDIDLPMERKPTESEKKKAKSAIIESAGKVGLSLSNPAAVLSKHGYNKYVFEYDSLFSEIPLEMIVETSFYQAVYPAEDHAEYSFVGRFCEGRGIKLPVPFEAAVVNMRMQTLERTFIDRVFAVCDYRIQDMQERDSRHLYDIAKLYPKVEINQELESLIDRVREDRMLSKNNPSARPGYNIPEMLREIISSRFYESDYNSITTRLLFEDVSYDGAVAGGIAKIAGLAAFEYRKNDQSLANYVQHDRNGRYNE